MYYRALKRTLIIYCVIWSCIWGFKIFQAQKNYQGMEELSLKNSQTIFVLRAAGIDTFKDELLGQVYSETAEVLKRERDNTLLWGIGGLLLGLLVYGSLRWIFDLGPDHP